MKVALTDLLQSIRIASVDAAFVELGAAGAVRFAGERLVFMYLVVSGSVTLDLDGDGHALQAGDCAFVFGNQAHCLRVGNPRQINKSGYFQEKQGLDTPPTLRFGRDRLAAVVLTSAFHLRAMQPLVRSLPRHIVLEAAAGGHGIRLDGADIARNGRGPGASAFMTTLTDMLFMQAVRSAVEGFFADGTASPSTLDSFRIPIVLSLMYSYPERPWTVAGLAGEINMSRSAFAAEFLESVGEPPMRYLSRLRLTRAARLLSHPPIAISDVAWQVGYQSLGTFIRAFKQFHGVTPTRFMQRRQGRRSDEITSQMHWAPFLAEDLET